MSAHYQSLGFDAPLLSSSPNVGSKHRKYASVGGAPSIPSGTPYHNQKPLVFKKASDIEEMQKLEKELRRLDSEYESVQRENIEI